MGKVMLFMLETKPCSKQERPFPNHKYQIYLKKGSINPAKKKSQPFFRLALLIQSID